jgi:hypothetical protein
MLVGTLVTIGVSYGVWYALDQALGAGLIAQIIEVGVALTAGGCAYVLVVFTLRVDEARQLIGMFRARFAR